MGKPVSVSVIVPMYNAERYLERCLDSLAGQRFFDFEALLVDDGSKDRTAQIAWRYADRDRRFRVIQKQNGGVASARNAGLAAASGTYAAFVDSDDFVDPDYLEQLYRAAEAQGADIACCNFNRYFPGLSLKLPHLITKRPGLYPSERILKSLLHDVAIQSYLWNKLWRRSLFEDNGIRFPETFFEDAQAVLRLVFYARRIAVIKPALYQYTQRGDSIVHTLNARSGNDFLGAFADTRIFLEEQGLYRRYRRHFRFYRDKSLLFIWGVVFLIHWREGRFRGFFDNLRRSTGFLSHYGGRRFLYGTPGPSSAEVLRPPSRPGEGREGTGHPLFPEAEAKGPSVHKKFPSRP